MQAKCHMEGALRPDGGTSIHYLPRSGLDQDDVRAFTCIEIPR